MSKLKTILVDDEPRGLTSLQKLLDMNCEQVEIIECCNSAASAHDAITFLQPQLVFLDVAMPEKNGFDLLHNLPAINFEIIFVTAHSNYMTQAFRFSAIDYLLKPIDEELLIAAVKRAEARITGHAAGQNVETLLHNIEQSKDLQKMKLCIPSIKGFQVVMIKDIIYCEASSNYTNFYFTDRPVICTSKPIHIYEEMLVDFNFIRTHKSFLVNLEHVSEYVRGEGGTIVLSNNHEVEVSRRKKDSFMTKMKDYFKF